MAEDRTTRAEWDQLSAEVSIAMREFAMAYATPISKALSRDLGEHLGNGTYLDLCGSKYILTNQHVAVHRAEAEFGHQFVDDDDVYRLGEPFRDEPYPLDVAVAAIKPEVWSHASHGSKALSLDKFATKHAPLERELLFMLGFSDERSKFLALHEALHSRATPYLTQEIPLPCLQKNPPRCWQPAYHFCLNYKPDLATTVGNGERYGLPKPPGLSGSLVWNTRRIDCLRQGINWTPDCAEVTGIVWAWPSESACLIATKIEHVRRFIEDASR